VIDANDGRTADKVTQGKTLHGARKSTWQPDDASTLEHRVGGVAVAVSTNVGGPELHTTHADALRHPDLQLQLLKRGHDVA
jgi:hypothetical protein